MRNGDTINLKLSWIDKPGLPIVLTEADLNLCDFLADFHNPCPWKPGIHHISRDHQIWPNILPTVSPSVVS